MFIRIVPVIVLATIASAAPAQPDLARELGRRRGSPGLDEVRREVASQVFSLPKERLEQVSASVEPFPYTGTVLIKLKAVDRQTGEVLLAGVDQHLRPVDPAALMQRWRQVRAEHPEVKWHRRLRRAIDEKPARRHPVAVWLDFPGDVYADLEAEVYSGIDWERATREKVREAELRIEAFVLEQNRRIVDGFRQRLEALGLAPTSWSASAPLVFTDANGAEARMIAALPQVDAVFLQNFEGSTENSSANRTHRTHRLHQMGVRGREIALTVLESGTVDPTHSDLLVTDYFLAPGSATAPGTSSHTTLVAGCAASHEFMNEGAAPDVDLQNANSASYSDAALVCAGDWVVFGPGGAFSSPGCASVPGPTVSTDVTSTSFGVSGSDPEPQLMDRYFEYQSRYFNDSYLNSAGNRGVANGNAGAGDGDGEITSPSKAWNVISVGNWDDLNDGSWENDFINPDSSFMDPAWQHDGTGIWTDLCQKPNVVACGTSVTAAGFVGTGTSFATPHVAGNLANAMAVSTVPEAYPEAAMALVMATAWNGLNVASLIDARSGVGGICGLAAVRAAKDDRVKGAVLTPATFAGGAVHTETITLEKNDRARVVIAWSADVSGRTASLATSYLYPTGHTPHTPTTVSHRPNADLDLKVYRGLVRSPATLVATSASLMNNYEVVEFTPSIAGVYTVEVSAARYDSPGAEALGLAWSQRTADISYVEFLEKAADVRAPTSGPTIGAGTTLGPGGMPTMPYMLDLYAPDNGGQAYFVVPSATIGEGFSLAGLAPFGGAPYPSGTLLPVELDWFFDYFVETITVGPPMWGDYSGLIDPVAGRSLFHNVAMPPIPGIEGFSFYQTALVTDAGTHSAATIAERKKITLWPAPSVKALGNDDSFVQALPFGFDFFGTGYTSCHVNSNGSVTFGGADTDPSPTMAEMYAGLPRIAFMWTDLDPTLVGHDGPAILRVREVFQIDSRVVIEFIDVTEHAPAGSSSTVRVTLDADDVITIEYLDCDPVGPVVVGITKGAGAVAPTGTTGEIDLSSWGLFEGAAGNALLEEFGPGGFDLADGNEYWDTVRFVPIDAARTSYRVELEMRKF